MKNFLNYTKFLYLFSALLFVGSLFLIFYFGLNLGIDFVGGSVLEVEFAQMPTIESIRQSLAPLEIKELILRPKGDNGLILRMSEIEEERHSQIMAVLSGFSQVQESRFESIGPAIGKELRDKTVSLVAVSLIVLLLYVAIAFRKVSWPISSWQYGAISIITLCFDITVTIGFLIFLGLWGNLQFSIPIVTALLTILGYTINDTVIIFDRVRENLIRHRSESFKEVVNLSLNQTFWRSLSTSFCTLLVLLAIIFWGGDTLRYFSLTLIAGIIIGTYSSLFLASPLLVSFLKFKKTK